MPAVLPHSVGYTMSVGLHSHGSAHSVWSMRFPAYQGSATTGKAVVLSKETCCVNLFPSILYDVGTFFPLASLAQGVAIPPSHLPSAPIRDTLPSSSILKEEPSAPLKVYV